MCSFKPKYTRSVTCRPAVAPRNAARETRSRQTKSGQTIFSGPDVADKTRCNQCFSPGLAPLETVCTKTMHAGSEGAARRLKLAQNTCPGHPGTTRWCGQYPVIWPRAITVAARTMSSPKDAFCDTDPKSTVCGLSRCCRSFCFTPGSHRGSLRARCQPLPRPWAWGWGWPVPPRCCWPGGRGAMPESPGMPAEMARIWAGCDSPARVTPRAGNKSGLRHRRHLSVKAYFKLSGA